MMVILYKVISFEIMCVWKMYILCVYALCVTITSIFNCESDVTDGFFEFIDSKESNW